MSGLIETFSALGDETRFDIVERLLAEGEQSAGDLQEVADILAPAILRHLKALRTAGVIRQRTDRQRRMYSVVPEAILSVNAWIEYHRKYWERSLDRLDGAMELEGPKDGGTED